MGEGFALQNRESLMIVNDHRCSLAVKFRFHSLNWNNNSDRSFPYCRPDSPNCLSGILNNEHRQPYRPLKKNSPIWMKWV